MSVLITGAGSALGREVLYLLRPQWDHVRALLNPGESLPIQLAGLRGVEADLGRRFSLPGLLQGVETVVHLGGGGSHRRQDRDATFRMELEYTGHLLTAAREVGIRHLIYRSSVFALGSGSSNPATEEGPWDLDRQPSPQVHALRIAYLEALRQGGLGLPLTVVIPTFLLGPGVEGTLGAVFHQVDQGGRVWVPPGGIDVVDVRDVAAQVVSLIQQPRVGTWLLSGTWVSYLDLCRARAQRSGASCHLVPRSLVRVGSKVGQMGWGPPPEVWSLLRPAWRFDGSRARAELGFGPRDWRKGVGKD